MIDRKTLIIEAYTDAFGSDKTPTFNWLKPELRSGQIYKLMEEAVRTGVELRREDLYPDWVLNPDPNKIY
jgi:hypothetical protein